MTGRTYTATGRLSNGRTLNLDQNLPISDGDVKVVVEPVQRIASRRPLDVLDTISCEREKSRSQEDIDQYIRHERESW